MEYNERISIFLQGEQFYITKEFARLYKLKEDQVIYTPSDCKEIRKNYKNHCSGRNQLINQFSFNQKKN